MSEQAEAKNPTAIEESEPEASPPPAPETAKAEEKSAEPAEQQPPQPAEAEETPQAQAAATGTAKAPEPAETTPEPPKPAAQETAGEETAKEETAQEEAAKEEAADPKAEAADQKAADRKTEAKAGEKAEEKAEAKAEEKAEEKAKEKAESKAEAEEEAEKKEPEPLTEEEIARRKEIEALRQAKDDKQPVEGRVIGWNQGGFHVVVGTITTFCPRSEMELKNPKSPNSYLDNSFKFLVIKHQKRGKRIVLSRKRYLEEERAKILEEMKDKLKPGNDLSGRVSSLTDFGAFVDLGGGIEGLVHITELSTRRVKHPRDIVELGQEVTVRVLKVEEGGDRISLSMKALEPNPYEEFAKEHPRGSKFQGKVVRKTDFGAFIELLPGLDGMVHVSQLPPGMDLEDPALETGKEVSGWVIRVEPKRERISLSLKEVPTEDPWKKARERYPEGAVVEGQVEDVAPFGVFIQLEPGLTGLLPNSEMSLPRGQDRSKHYPPGKKVKIQVGSVDPQRKRISLAPEGSKLEGSRSDYKEYLQQQKKKTTGMTAMAAAFAKLQDEQEGE